MHDQMSLWSLFANASLIVQAVMALLLAVSVISWAMIFQRSRVLKVAGRTLKEFEELFWSGMDLGKLYRQVDSLPEGPTGVEAIFRSGFKEFNRLHQKPGVDPDAVMVGAQRAMRVVVAREEEKLEAHLPFLATVGSTSPYIGLFGTVWGIMNSFRGLANVHQATLATVAPGIAEALVATAMGLFAAIPAVIAYNRYATRVDILTNSYETFAEEFSSILHRQAHGGHSAH